jgi:hypothetical protein
MPPLSGGGSSPGGGSGPDEWSAIRSVISAFDTNLHDLRKTGLAVITALLTATAVSTLFGLPNYEVFILIFLTIVLIIIMQYLDQDYRTFQKAAMARATVIEPMLNVELSQKIATIYKNNYMYLVNPILYSALVIIAGILGCAIIYSGLPANNPANVSLNTPPVLFTNNSAIVSSDNSTILSTAVSVNISPATTPSNPSINSALVSLGIWYIAGLIVAMIGAIFLIVWISKTILPDYKRESTGLQDDWIVDKVACVKGDVVKITVTNLGENVVIKTVNPGETVWIPDLGQMTFIKNYSGETIITVSKNVLVAAPVYKITIADTGDKVTVTDPDDKHITVTEKIQKQTILGLGELTVTKTVKGETLINLEDKVTVTILNEKITVTLGGLFFDGEVFKVFDENNVLVDSKEVNKEVFIPLYENHSWLWETAPAHVKAGAMYKIMPVGWAYPLTQITVLDRLSDDAKPKPERIGDYEWSIDKASCRKEEVVTITVTNIRYPWDKTPLTFDEGNIVCIILNDSDKPDLEKLPECCIIRTNTTITILPDCSHSWIWNTGSDKIQENAIYSIRPLNSKDPANPSDPFKPSDPLKTPISLKQTITILKKDPGLLKKIL